MFSGQSKMSNASLSLGYLRLFSTLVLVTVLVELSSADLTDYYMRALKRSDEIDECEGAIPGGGHCGLERDSCCEGFECKRLNIFFRRWTRCPSTTRRNSYCRCVRVKMVEKRAYPGGSWDLMDPWSDNSSPYYK